MQKIQITVQNASGIHDKLSKTYSIRRIANSKFKIFIRHVLHKFHAVHVKYFNLRLLGKYHVANIQKKG